MELCIYFRLSELRWGERARLNAPTFLSSPLALCPSSLPPLLFKAMNFHFLHDARALLLRPLAAWPHVAMMDQLNVINKSAKKSQSRGVGVSVAVKICERPRQPAGCRLSVPSECAPSSLPPDYFGVRTTNVENETNGRERKGKKRGNFAPLIDASAKSEKFSPAFLSPLFSLALSLLFRSSQSGHSIKHLESLHHLFRSRASPSFLFRLVLPPLRNANVCFAPCV